MLPEHGDIVVRQERRAAGHVYVLHNADGIDQILHRTRDKAVAHALSFARRERVRVWIANGDNEFTLVENFRPRA